MDMKAYINDENIEITIREWDKITLLIFEIYSKWKIKKEEKDMKEFKENLPKNLKVILTPISENQEIQEKPETSEKAPYNTNLFLNWIEKDRPQNFSPEDFKKRYTRISKEQANKIFTYQAKIGNIIQIDTDLFTTKEMIEKMSHGRFMNDREM